MMKIVARELLTDLRERTQQNLLQAEKLNQCTLEELNHRNASRSWNVLECIEHLNYYGKFYLPEIETRIGESKYPPEKIFISGFLGNYFAESMLPMDGMKRIKTLKSQDPRGRMLDRMVLREFIAQQEKLLELLEMAEAVSLIRTKTGISIAKWIRLRLGDTFRILIYHNQRHLLQAQNVLKIRHALVA